MGDQKNLLLAIGLSVVILLGFQLFYEQPRIESELARQAEQAEKQAGEAGSDDFVPSRTGDAGDLPTIPGAASPTEQAKEARKEILASDRRIRIKTDKLTGSISLNGGEIDDLVLQNYNVTLGDDANKIVLLSPRGSPAAYYASFGWSSGDKALALPGPDTVWTSPQQVLTSNTPVQLTWRSPQGLDFIRTISIDDDYLFTVTDKVTNGADTPVDLADWGLISRHGVPETLGFYILHEGPIGVFNETLTEIDYDDLQEQNKETIDSVGGWLGITDKYWLTALIPPQDAAFTGGFRHRLVNGTSKFQVDFLNAPIRIPAGGIAETTHHLFAGAKVVNTLDRYGETLNIPLFDRAVDFGWFYFLTKPLFYVIEYFNRMLGNFGLAILLLTICVKACFFPLANKSYKAMSKMKALQPEMVKLREKHGSDRQKMNQAMMELYKREKVNPAAGCLPVLVQIPVFFALYKVLFVAIEMRHAPFYGWIKDLSAPDPTTMFNLFGLIPWDPPQILMIGIWPLAMGISMYAQQLLNPQPADPVQAKIFLLMPIFFTFLLASFPAGLVVYWTWNNLLSLAQQYIIMKRMGVPIGGGRTKAKAGASGAT